MNSNLLVSAARSKKHLKCKIGFHRTHLYQSVPKESLSIKTSIKSLFLKQILAVFLLKKKFKKIELA